MSVLALLLPFTLHAQTPAPEPAPTAAPAAPTITFSFDRPGLAVSTYVLTVGQDATGRYAGSEVIQAAGNAAPSAPQPFDRTFTLTPTTTARIFSLASELSHFNITCASKAKNIADTGKKTLRYTGPDGQGACTYNYSESKSVQALTDIFLGITQTMDEGRRLEYFHRFDHLGLDAALESLTTEVAEGHALEIGTIAPTLTSIVNDPHALQRVRTRANALLNQAASAH